MNVILCGLCFLCGTLFVACVFLSAYVVFPLVGRVAVAPLNFLHANIRRVHSSSVCSTVYERINKICIQDT
ncbi:hypothetical protein VNO78_25482 [Psophocarpus tetragonolobus]|uniref:Uncharacterized protein n=1 Tax=Psophocarpus tetragonolobus TaxID=3891 RepID=A0AAN9SA73_PSOTE